jgi:hypothetical protein
MSQQSVYVCNGCGVNAYDPVGWLELAKAAGFSSQFFVSSFDWEAIGHFCSLDCFQASSVGIARAALSKTIPCVETPVQRETTKTPGAPT